jgi:hypothetical protein
MSDAYSVPQSVLRAIASSTTAILNPIVMTFDKLARTYGKSLAI